MKRRLIIPLAIVLAVVAAGVLLSRQLRGTSAGGETPKKAPLVRTTPAEQGTVERILRLTGTAEAQRRAQLASPAEGPVTDLRVREGDPVRGGEPLVSIGRKSAVDARTVSLQEELSEAEENLRRIESLVRSDAVPGERLDEAKTRRERARAALVAAEESARDYTVAAPWNGVVARAHVRNGDFVTPRTTLLELYDPTSLVVVAAVPEKDAISVRPGMALRITLDAYPGAGFTGRIARVHPYLVERTRTRTIEVEIWEAVDLLPGMFARLEIPLAAARGATIVPIEALVPGPADAYFVFVVGDGKATRRAVETGIEQDGRVQITSGVAPGESVAIAGHERLRDGATVRLSGAAGRPQGEGSRK